MKCPKCKGTGTIKSSIKKLQDPVDSIESIQTINGKTSHLQRGCITLIWIKRRFGNSFFNQFKELKSFPHDTTLTWLREHSFKVFKKVMLEGLGDKLLDFRIKKNLKIKTKRAQLLRDVNYRELFGVERAIELHPCYFDRM